MTFAREAWPFVVPILALSLVLLALGRWRSAAVAFVATAAVLLFFRIPARSFEGDADILLAPASGHVTAIETVDEPEISDQPVTRIVTFLSVFDVHVQRSPASGTVVAAELRRGRKVAAFRKDAGEINESQTTVLKLDSGELIAVRQLAGLVARRVVGYLSPGDSIRRGDLLGVIKFGSRVDLIVPADYSVLVTKGQRVHEGLTPMARRPGETS